MATRAIRTNLKKIEEHTTMISVISICQNYMTNTAFLKYEVVLIESTVTTNKAHFTLQADQIHTWYKQGVKAPFTNSVTTAKPYQKPSSPLRRYNLSNPAGPVALVIKYSHSYMYLNLLDILTGLPPSAKTKTIYQKNWPLYKYIWYR